MALIYDTAELVDGDVITQDHPAYPQYGPGYPLMKDGDIFRRADSSFMKGQYVMPRYAPGRPGNIDLSRPGRSYQRATTFVGMTEYKGPQLAQWREMHLVHTLIKHPDLLIRASKLIPSDKRRQTKERKRELDAAWGELLAEVEERAEGLSEASRCGSEIHAGIEWVNKGGSVADLPTEYRIAKNGGGFWIADLSIWDRQVQAYVDLRDGVAGPGFSVTPEDTEGTVINDRDEVVGKTDFIGRIELTPEILRAAGFPEADENGVPYADEPGKPRMRIFDAKSGEVSADYGKRDNIGRQLYFYATCDAVFTATPTPSYRSMADLDVDDRIGFIVKVDWFVPEGEKVVAELIPVLFEKNGGAPGLEACRTVKVSKRGQARAMSPIAVVTEPERTSKPVVETVVAEPVTKIPAPRKKRTIKTPPVADGMTMSAPTLTKVRKAKISVEEPAPEYQIGDPVTVTMPAGLVMRSAMVDEVWLRKIIEAKDTKELTAVVTRCKDQVGPLTDELKMAVRDALTSIKKAKAASE